MNIAKAPLSGDIIGPKGDAFTIHGMRYRQPFSTTAATLEEAVGQCAWAIDDNNYAPERITNIAGETVLEGDQLDKAMDAYREKYDL